MQQVFGRAMRIPTAEICCRRCSHNAIGRAAISRPTGRYFRALAVMRPACGGFGPMWASAPTNAQNTRQSLP